MELVTVLRMLVVSLQTRENKEETLDVIFHGDGGRWRGRRRGGGGKVEEEEEEEDLGRRRGDD